MLHKKTFFIILTILIIISLIILAVIFAKQAENKKERIYTFNITATDHWLGNFDSPNTLVVFHDFTCPFSAEYFLTLGKFIQAHENDLRIIIRSFPSDQNNPAAISSATAAECAGGQGKFFKFSEQLLALTPTNYNYDSYLKIAAGLNLNPEVFKTCLDNPDTQKVVQAHYQEGLVKGVSLTPTSFFNGKKIEGSLPEEELGRLISTK
jgi:protein-disulfide isomerase